MLTRKGSLLAVALVAIAATAVVFRSWVLALAGVPLALALAAGLVRAVLPAPEPAAQLWLGRTRLLAGDVEPVTLRVESRAGRAGLAEIGLDVHPFVEVKGGSPAALAALGPMRPVETSFDVSFPVRGRYEVAHVLVRERGLMGLFQREHRLEPGARVEVMPQWEMLDELKPLARRHRHQAGAVLVGRHGAGQEFFGLRGYLPGDPIDAVNWKQTAKRGRPIVNEHEHEAPADLVLVLDAREHGNVGAGYASTLESGIRAVVSLSERTVRDRYKVGLVVLGPRIEWIHPATGRRQHERIVERLLDVWHGGWYQVGSVLPGLPANVLPKGATVVLVTPGHADPTLPWTVQALAARHVRCVVLAPSPETAEVAHGALGRKGEAAARVLRLERRRFLEGLRRSGALVVDWDVRRPLAEALVPLGGVR